MKTYASFLVVKNSDGYFVYSDGIILGTYKDGVYTPNIHKNLTGTVEAKIPVDLVDTVKRICYCMSERHEQLEAERIKKEKERDANRLG